MSAAFGPKRYNFAARRNTPIGYQKIEALWRCRRDPYKPWLSVRNEMKKEEHIRKFEDSLADGKVFIPDGRQPPWKKINNPMLDRTQGEKVNFQGFRVRLALPQHSAPGFPTHYQ